MNGEPAISSVARVIQLSIAPVFLLTALGTMLSVFSTRLGRIVDRFRVLTDRLPVAPKELQGAIRDELGNLRKRRRVVNVAITFATGAALLVCVLIAIAFTSTIVGWDSSRTIAGLFVAAMLAFIGALLAYLSEVSLAVRAVWLKDPRW
jgi:hypothetical protein